MKRRSIISFFIVLTMLATLLTGCGDKVPTFTADTTIHYSAGDDSERAYGNQQKEFPDGEGSVTLDVIYDDQVDDRYDVRNTVYFSGKAADIEAGIH